MADNGRYPWMKFFPKNFIADTLSLNPSEIGAYMLMLCKAWDMDGKLPFNLDSLARITGTKSSLIKSTVSKLSASRLVHEENGFLRIQMIDRDLDRVFKTRARNSEKGKRSGEVQRLRIVGGDE